MLDFDIVFCKLEWKGEIMSVNLDDVDIFRI